MRLTFKTIYDTIKSKGEIRLKILIAAYFDDNYGDVLIRTCFTQLLKVALQNLDIEYTLDIMSLMQPCEKQIKSADLIIVPGGAMFGVSYLGVTENIEKMLAIAEKNGVKVVFSSLGLNYLKHSPENDERLKKMLSLSCIQALSNRDGDEVFNQFTAGLKYKACPVCDPAVWCGTVYGADVKKILAYKKRKKKPVVGINVVRNGLFGANGIDWPVSEQENYLITLSKNLENRGIDYRFFTNGQSFDINALLHFAARHGIPKEKLIFCDTSREVIKTMAAFDAVVAIRMHTSIISYALGVPSVNYVWHPKISDFYRKIGQPDRAVLPDKWSAEAAAEWATTLLNQRDYTPDAELLMTLYTFLYDTLRKLSKKTKKDHKIFSYNQVCKCLNKMSVSAEEDDRDLRMKLSIFRARFYKLSKSNDEKKHEIQKLTNEVTALRTENEALKKELLKYGETKQNA